MVRYGVSLLGFASCLMDNTSVLFRLGPETKKQERGWRRRGGGLVLSWDPSLEMYIFLACQTFSGFSFGVDWELPEYIINQARYGGLVCGEGLVGLQLAVYCLSVMEC